MSDIVKFSFDRRFDIDARELARRAEEAAEPPPPPPPTFSEEELAAARAAAHADGRQAGIEEAEKRTGRQAALALGVIGERLAEIVAAEADRRAVAVDETAALARAIANKLAGNALARDPAAEVEALTRECLERLFDEPRMTVRVHPDLVAELERRLEGAGPRAGFSGSIEIAADAALVPGDCRVEWERGGAERRINDLRREVDAILDRFVAPATATDDADPSNVATPAAGAPPPADHQE